MPTEHHPRILLVRGGTNWQLQTGFTNPNGRGCAVHNIATRAEHPGSEPPYEAAARTLRLHHGVTSVEWTPGMAGSPDLPGVWHATHPQ
ncbi:hypothetical protein [Streptomyces sp. NBC_01304]|uniref:hypothetical protein n=1 Tax=Streptomyces sp. NBC_01304 TaxID=2903818 RepID=UPI002E15C6B3|nr:hypothetical protein OG430_48780 [Streptomyces sp. NBC_01304]